MSNVKSSCQKQKNMPDFTAIQESIYRCFQKGASQSAYEILDKIKKNVPNAKPMTVYRALSYLENKGLIHKIKSTSAYSLCKHSIHQGAVIFLICQHCGIVKEMDINKNLIKEFTTLTNAVGFSAVNHGVELTGSCQTCDVTA